MMLIAMRMIVVVENFNQAEYHGKSVLLTTTLLTTTIIALLMSFNPFFLIV